MVTSEGADVRVYISVDMEGIAGIATLDQVIRGGHGYPAAQRLMTAEANAAIAGAFDGGATAVVVNDSHGTMDNLLMADLDPRTRLVLGSPKLDCMAEGLTDEFDVALFIGYHGPAGSRGVLAHTYSSYFTEVRLNGVPVSEADVNALQAAAVGVPVGLLSGDDVICDLVGRTLPAVHAVAVKTALGYAAANSMSPDRACTAIRDAAAAVVSGPPHQDVCDLPSVLGVEIDMPHAIAAEYAALMPGVERVSGRAVQSTFTQPGDAIMFIMAAYQFAVAGLTAWSPLLQRR
jgi:D-amino peptidase